MSRTSFTPLGIVQDIPAYELAPDHYSRGENILFRRGLAERAPKGVKAFGSIISPPVYLLNSVGQGTVYWLVATDDGAKQEIFATDGDQYVDITPGGMLPWTSEANALTGGNHAALPFINTGPESFYWDRDYGTPTIMVPLDGAPIVNAMRAHNNRLMALNTINDNSAQWPQTEQTIVWTSVPQAGTMPTAGDWIPAVDNSAGDNQLSGGGPLIDGLSLRNSFVVYSQDHIWIMDEIGGAFVFNTRQLSSGTGILSRNCVADTPRGHVVLTSQDVLLNNGANIESIIDNRNKRFLFSQLGDNWINSFVVYNTASNEVWICIPTGADTYPNLAAVYDLGADKWGFVDLPNMAAGATGVLPFPPNPLISWDDYIPTGITWNTINRIWNQPAESSVAEGLLLAWPGAPLVVSMDELLPGDPANIFTESAVEKADIVVSDAGRIVTVTRIWPRIEGTSGDTVTMRVGVRDALDGAPTTWASLPFVIGEQQSADIFATGRYVTVRVAQTDPAGSRYTFSGFDVEFEDAGAF